jgi:lysophospholipase L1-like esterase
VRRLGLFLLAALAALAAAAPTATARDYASYVALGDSFTAGPFIPNQTGRPVGCARSDNNYPSKVAEVLAPAKFVDVSCSSAQTKHMTQPQSVPGGGENPPQFNVLSQTTELVSVGIGGNDIGFGEISETCVRLGLTDPTGSPCKDHYTRTGKDEVRERIKKAAPKVAGVLKGIDQRSRAADVLIVGYPVILPDEGPGCYPLIPIPPGDVEYLRGIEKDLNAMIREQAARQKATFVDTYESSIGHDACQLPGVKWVEGVVPTEPAYPVHPNERGMENSARQVLKALGR